LSASQDILDNYSVLLDDQATGRQLYFSKPKAIITAHNIHDVPAAFEAVETAISDGYYIAGYFAYELGLTLEPSLQLFLAQKDNTQEFNADPLLKLGVFSAPKDTAPIHVLYNRSALDIKLSPSWSEADYIARFERLKAYIDAGDCYQVNLTFPLIGQTDASSEEIFATFRQNQPGRYGALVKLGGADIISFSPELFFERTGQNMRMRPMKGTRPRNQKGSAADDAAIAQAMRAEPKSQAENLMIVDLLRNDLSRLAQAGSVKVPELFTLETYPTVHQMTSQVTAQLNPDLSWLEIFKGLYPCGSVTGAPKIRAMEIIDELEDTPRGPYCGAIGFIAPDNSACFNVAIRTGVLDEGHFRYDVGSGVVYDSHGADEYRECLLKSHILIQKPEHIFETFRRDSSGDYIRIEAHLDRLRSACQDKGWAYPETQIQTELHKAAQIDKDQNMRVRLEIGRADKTGDIYAAIKQSVFIPKTLPLSIAISRYPLTPDIQNSDIKTSRRDFYDGERARIQAVAIDNNMPPIDEVVFLSPSGALCEGSFTSIYVELGGTLYTPPLSQNILPSILRDEMLQAGQAQECNLNLDNLFHAEAIFCGNSLRGLMRAKLITETAL